jgi:uncharacterized protein YbjT (DUF2867 family)
MTETILITGPTGNIGGPLVERLSAQGVAFRALVRRAQGNPLAARANVTLVEGDLARPETLAAAFAGVDRLFLLLPLAENMLEMNAAAVAAAKRAGVKRIVKLSGMFPMSDPNDPRSDSTIELGGLHRETERQIEASGAEWTFLRPNSFYQNYLVFSGATIRAHNAFYLPYGDAKISLIDARDVAAVAVAALTTDDHVNAIYELTGPESLTNAEVAAALSGALNRTIAYVPVPEDAARQEMLKAGLSEWYVRVVLELYAAQRNGLAAHVTPDAAQVLGRAPVSFAEFAREFAASFQP